MIPACKEIRKEILKISSASGHGHVPSCFSVVEILYSVYDTIKHDPKDPGWDGRDIFILSKGHAALAYYCVLAQSGYFGVEKVRSFGSFGSAFGCHPDRKKVPGVEASTGSLGHGIGIAAGVALAFKVTDKKRRVFVLIGDGESNEGAVWEAAMVAADLGLSNLTVIYDDNRSQARGLQIKNPSEKFRAFGFDVSEVNGHSISELKKELGKESAKPKAVIARTQKGFGCKTLVKEHQEWHRKSPDQKQLCGFLEELDEEAI